MQGSPHGVESNIAISKSANPNATISCSHVRTGPGRRKVVGISSSQAQGRVLTRPQAIRRNVVELRWQDFQRMGVSTIVVFMLVSAASG